MPHRKPSLGKLEMNTVYPEEFGRWLGYELYDYYQWNRQTVNHKDNTVKPGPAYMSEPALGKYSCMHIKTGFVLWSITINQFTTSENRKYAVEVISDQPTVHIRKGLYFEMGNNRLVVEA